MTKKIKIFRAYLTREKQVTAQDIADQFGITRRAVHQAVEEVRSGSKVKLEESMQNYKKDCLWQTKYLPWYDAIKDFRGNEALTSEFRFLLHTMKMEGFTSADIARYMKRDHSTVRHHLNRYEKAK